NIAGAGIDLWNEEDQFFCDVVHLPSGQNIQLRIHSMVGLVPLLAVLAWRPSDIAGLESFRKRMLWFLQNRPNLAQNVARWDVPRQSQTSLPAILHRD